MSWYKRSQQITTFYERNVLNARIHHLEEVAKRLEKASDLIYQTQRGARGMVQSILADKMISSFPDIKKVLSEADKVAMDSPRKFSSFALKGVDEINKRVKKMKAERKRATEEGLPRR